MRLKEAGAARFLEKARNAILTEWGEAARQEDFRRRIGSLSARLSEAEPTGKSQDIIREVWQVFFPEGALILSSREQALGQLRRRRTVRITRPNPRPLRNAAREILFTANALLTIPGSGDLETCGGYSAKLRGCLESVCREPQRYWYDHPVPVGVAQEENEIVHGLRGLRDALEFEIRRGSVGRDARLSCVLSVSTTHDGLREAARPYLEESLRDAGDLSGLCLYAFTERETRRLLDEVILPAGRHYLGEVPEEALLRTIGVDGEYGRHYSFLKAVSAFWQVLVDPAIRATFKFDLDQVFPQAELVSETGKSAFEHLCTPLWGAEGLDASGRNVHLGMCAGALVNDRDIEKGLFTPDVPYPALDPAPDQWIFFSSLPQALSTEAEMMARYGQGLLDGRERVLQRVHVTGGTCGILVESLRRYRPFTPSMIGRAEDQAYVLSVLFDDARPALRYLHASGLIMRHDKESLAPRAIRAATAGKEVGDLVRTLVFSRYAGALPCTLEEIKGELDPFTGCFISRIPQTVACLRLALRTAALFAQGNEAEAMELLRIGAERLEGRLGSNDEASALFLEAWEKERHAWGVYYEVMDALERGLRGGDVFAAQVRERARRLVEDCKVRI